MKNEELNLCKNSSLFKFPFKKRYIFKNLYDCISKLKYIPQRLKYGISQYDAWDLDSYLFTVIENGLKYLKDAGNSHPLWCTFDEWQTKLTYMIKLCEIVNLYEDEITDISFNKYLEAEEKYGIDSEECKKLKEKWMEDEKEFDELKETSSLKLLKELEKYIHDLWD